jgi:hypothetical protein
MPRVRDLLYRFRPASAPGSASASGVPVDRAADRAAELLPLFERLAETERQCALIRAQAQRDADAIRARHTEVARSVAVTASDDVEAERARAATQVRQQADSVAAAALIDAQQEASQLQRRAAQRMPAYVALIVSVVDALAGHDQPVGRP